MLVESKVEFCSPQHIPGASQQNSVAAFLLNILSRWRLVLKCKKNNNQKKHLNGSKHAGRA